MHAPLERRRYYFTSALKIYSKLINIRHPGIRTVIIHHLPSQSPTCRKQARNTSATRSTHHDATMFQPNPTFQSNPTFQATRRISNSLLDTQRPLSPTY